MKECNYPKCTECQQSQCNMDNKDIAALLKRRRYKENPDYYRAKQQKYRENVKANLPHCDSCDMCIKVKNDKGNGERRLCVQHMRLIEQKVSNSPHWCCLRKKKKEEVERWS